MAIQSRYPLVEGMLRLLVLVQVLVAVSAYTLPRLSARKAFQLQASEATPSTPPLTEGAPEWQGAKKFSMKDRYTTTVLSNEQIAKILPHRYPFLLVDKVVEFEPGKRAVGIKCVTANEPQFTGHFPDRPIMPGVLMIEAMAQLGGIICLSPPVTQDGGQKIFFFTGVNGVRWDAVLMNSFSLYLIDGNLR